MPQKYLPIVFKTKTGFMQRILDHVRFNYIFYTTGTVSRSKAKHFVEKFQHFYGVHFDKNQRSKAKKNGHGSASVLFYEQDSETLFWILLVTPGDHPAHRLERLQNALDPKSRITVTGYCLSRHIRSGDSAPSFSWAMTSETYDSWRVRIISLVRTGSPFLIRQAIYSLYHVPGFAISRKQVGKLVSLFKTEWARSRPSQPLPDFPAQLPFVRRHSPESELLWRWMRGSVELHPVKAIEVSLPIQMDEGAAV